MENYQTCGNCGEKNALHALTCNSCRAYLRERVVNIDLGNFIFKLIEEPFNSMRRVIFAEHKNYSILFFILLLLKIFSMTFILRNFLPVQKFYSQFFSVYFVNIIVYVTVIFLVWNSLLYGVHKLMNLDVRYKDQLATSVFASMPVILGFLILIPVEIALFGMFWFTFNPSPFFIKTNPAYVLYGVEAILLIWTLFLFYVQFHVRTKKVIYSLVAAILTFFVLFGLPLIVPIIYF